MSNITCPLRAAAEKFPDNKAILYGDKSLTYRELDNLAARIGRFYLEQGYEQGDRIAFAGTASPRFIASIHAAPRIGIVVCPISSRLTESGFRETLNSCSPRALIEIDMDDSKRKHCSTNTISLPQTDQLPSLDEETEIIISLKQAATIVMTSGTISSPKVAVHTVGNWYYSTLGMNKFIDLKIDDSWLLSLPLYHAGGLGIMFRAVNAGATLVLPDKGETLIDILTKNNITHISLVAAQLHELLDNFDNIRHCLHHLKAVLLGGSDIPARLIERGLDMGLPLVVSYGLTEMSSTVTANKVSRPISESSGSTLPYRQIHLSETGEVQVRGKTLFLGYLVEAKIQPAVDIDGWFNTGDCGYLDEQDELVITGRKDAMFISGGENIYPEEIEAALKSDVSVKEAMVVAIDDAHFGHRPVAFIQMDNCFSIDEDQLRGYLRDKLEKFKIPDHFLAWPSNLAMESKPSRAALAEIASKLLKSH